MKILDAIYFNNVGIVLVDDRHEIKSYIKYFGNMSEKETPKHIADWGDSFPLKAAYELFPQFKDYKIGENLNE